MKKDNRFLENVDRDAICFVAAVGLLSGVGGLAVLMANETLNKNTGKEVVEGESRKDSLVVDTVAVYQDCISVAKEAVKSQEKQR